ncbi:ATP-binding protein [Aerococcus viridans]|uniref:ATP-binding protein n=1 Tax=Aerococcus viridans TaxID=1377 RepID=UPI003B220FC1
MKIKTLELENFRSYKNLTTIEFENLTTIIGKNDIGKSTILEALDIFFNDKNALSKFDTSDINITASSSKIAEATIAIEFTDLPKEIILDESVTTTLAEEFLLTENKTLKIIKKFPASGSYKTYLVAQHPSHENCNNLHSKKNKDLKAIVDKYNIQDVNKTINTSLRKSIWNYFKHNSEDGLNLNLQQIDISKGDTESTSIKSIYSKINSLFPVYFLFQADRKNEDTDEEVQDPLKHATAEILATPEIKEKLDEISVEVNKKLQEVADNTLVKVKEMDQTLFNTLDPKIPDSSQLKWSDVFKKVSITGDNNIPLNKRGSGVKRLILLNFFRAEAERKSKSNNDTSNVIYAIEEPETSLHSDMQVMLIQSLINLSALNNTQLILTTHSSNVVKQLGFNQLRLVVQDKIGNKSVNSVQQDVVPFPSLNEVNYIAFDDITEEYHNELFGVIDENQLIEDYRPGRTQREYKRIKPDGTTKIERIELTTYIRHLIHHPENTLNDRYTKIELAESIRDMRIFLKSCQ